MGTAQVDTETTLLAVLDSAKQRGLQVNASVMRRGLKSMINTDFKLENWSNMVSRSYDTVLQLFDAEGGDSKDGSSAENFYVISCGQVFQKLLRASSSKFKHKDSTWDG